MPRKAPSTAAPAAARAAVPAPAPKTRSAARAAPSMAPNVKPLSKKFKDTKEEVEDWLTGLDGGRGALVAYGTVILEQFGSLEALSACVMSQDGSVMSRVDASLWDVLNVKSLGHRLLMAKGICSL